MTASQRHYIYAGRILRAPGGDFVTTEETKTNVVLAHQILGTPKDAWHPNIVFGEPHDIWGWLIELLIGANSLIDVWVAAPEP